MNVAVQKSPEPRSVPEELALAVATLRAGRVTGEGSIDYEGYRSSPEYWAFLKLLKRVEDFDPAEQSDVQARAFWINLYNAAAVHGIVQRGFPESALGRRAFYAEDLVHVGGCGLSLDDIEHGVLRSNRRAPGRLTRPFGLLDRRKDWALSADPRIHFAINCGARSCPPIRHYDPECLDEQLDVATRSFLNQEVTAKEGTLWASPLLDWYAKDFGDVRQFLARYHDDPQVRQACGSGADLKFKEYDWGSNASF